ncbi:MAG TPA: acetyl-CoA carboxylase biotin carboxyl carrier protein [Desulfomonilia bacterium]
MNLKTLKDVIDIIKGTDIVELEWTPERIHVVRGIKPQPEKASSEPRAMTKVEEKPTITVTSPLVGTFYRASVPEAQPFVQVGDRVAKGQCLCVIEAMKLMNEIESHVNGTVSAILKQDGERVGYGDPLFIIEGL